MKSGFSRHSSGDRWQVSCGSPIASGIIELWQAYQWKAISDGLDYIVSFSPASGSRAILYGIFKVCGRRSGRDGDLERSPEQYPEQLRFSILQILPKSVTRDEVIQREALFKQKLGSRAHGLNAN